jgi:hypothetical protein
MKFYHQPSSNSLSNQTFLLSTDIQQALPLVFAVKNEQTLKKLIFVKVLDETSHKMDVVLLILRFLFAVHDFDLLVVHDFAEFESESISAFIAFHLADVFVFVVGQVRQQTSDEDSEESICLLDFVAFEVERAKFLEEAKSFDLNREDN